MSQTAKRNGERFCVRLQRETKHSVKAHSKHPPSWRRLVDSVQDFEEAASLRRASLGLPSCFLGDAPAITKAAKSKAVRRIYEKNQAARCFDASVRPGSVIFGGLCA